MLATVSCIHGLTEPETPLQRELTYKNNESKETKELEVDNVPEQHLIF